MHYFANVNCFAWKYSIPVMSVSGSCCSCSDHARRCYDSLQALDMHNILSKYTGRPSSVSIDISNAIT